MSRTFRTIPSGICRRLRTCRSTAPPPEGEEAWFDLGHEPALTQEPTLFADEAPLPSEPAVSAPAPTAAQRVAGTKALAARITGELNPEQARAVTTTDGPLLILAGAGSGKTRVLAHRVAYLVGVRGIPPWQILAVTFTNRAAGELRERIIALIGDKAGRDVQAGTFHALCARVLRRDGEAIGIGRNFVVYDTDDQGALMKRILNDEGVEAKGPTRPSAILGRISRAKNEMVDPSEIDEYIPITGGRIAVARLAGLYRDRLAAAGALDFDDLLLAAVRLFDEAPDVLTRYQDRWRFLHVDEYQDTNRPQYLWIKALAAKHRNLAVVGDDDQSIYGWRGADIRNILDFERDYPGRRRRQARAELPEHAAHPRCGARGRVAQHGTDREEALDLERRRAPHPALRGVRRGRRGRVDRPPDRGARGRRFGAHPPGRRRRREAQGDRRRGHVPDERPVPRDRGSVPALSDPVPARGRDAVLPAPRGQGRPWPTCASCAPTRTS